MSLVQNTKTGQSFKLPSSRFFDVTRPIFGKKAQGARVCVSRPEPRGGSAHTHAHTSLSNVPKQAAAVPDAKLTLIGQLFGIPELVPTSTKPDHPTFHLSLGIMKSRVRVRAESSGVRRSRMYHGMSFSRRSQRLVNDLTGEILSLSHYLTLQPSEQAPYRPLGDFTSGTRSEITTFSEKSRARLLENAHEVTAELKERGIKPGFMLTLTYPGDWRSVAPDGRAVKRHLDKIERRLKRYFTRLGMSFSALWFLEFQKRGAPHFHLILWGEHLKLTDLQYRQAQTDLRTAWAEVVAHSDPVHRENHRRRGVGFERMKKGHLGYAAKYAKKMTQKTVPDEFANVGRFWGFWNYKTASPELLSVDVNHEQLQSLWQSLNYGLFQSFDKNTDFINRIARTILPVVTYPEPDKPKYSDVNGSCTVFGEFSAHAVRCWVRAGFNLDRKAIIQV